MAISFVNVATWTDHTSATTFTFNKPASVQPGDVLIAFVCAPSTGSVGAPTLSGWTHIYDGIGNFGSGSDTFSAAWWRTVDGTEGSSWTSGTFSGGGVTSNTVVVAYRGVHPTDPFVVWDQSVPGGMGTTPLTDNPAFNVEDAGGWIVNFMGYRSSAASTTSAHNLGFTERSDVSDGTSSTFETVALYDSNGDYKTLGGMFCSVTSTQTAVSGGTWTAQLRPNSGFPILTEPLLRDNTATSNTGSSTLAHSTMPTHRTGDLLVWVTSAAKASGSFATTATSGWTQLTVQNSGSGTGIHQQQVWYKFATSSSESGPTITLGGTGTSNLGIISHMTTWRYVDAAPTIFAGNSGTTSTTFASASVTTTTDNCAVVRGATIRDGSTTPTISWPGTETLINTTNCSTSASVGTSLNGRMTQSVARDVEATAGASGAVNATISSGAPTSFAGIAVALSNSFRPATETGSGVDAYIGTTVAQGADTGSGADTASSAVQGPSAATDTGSGADAAGTQKISGTNDASAAGADSQSVLVSGTNDASSAGADSANLTSASNDATPAAVEAVSKITVAGTNDASAPAADTAATAATTPVSGDTGSGSDTASVRIVGTDTGSGAEAVNSIFGQDTGSGADNAAGVSVSGAADTGSGADTAVATNTAIVGDTSTAAEAASVMVTAATDPGSLSDTVLGFGTDDGTGTDTARVSVSGAADTGSGAESAFSSNSTSDGDTGSGTDSASRVTSASADTGLGTDNSTGVVVGLGADTGSGADTAAVVGTESGSDTGSGADGQTAALTAADTGSGVDSAILHVTVSGAADTGAGADTAAASSQVVGTDTGSGADTATVIVQAPDTGSGAETAAVRAGAGDTGSGNDAAAVRATITDADTGSGLDGVIVIVKGTNDLGSWSDSSGMFVAYGPVAGPRAIRIPAEDRTIAVPLEPRTLQPDGEVRLLTIGKDLSSVRGTDPDYEQSTESRTQKVKAEVRYYTAEVDA